MAIFPNSFNINNIVSDVELNCMQCCTNLSGMILSYFLYQSNTKIFIIHINLFLLEQITLKKDFIFFVRKINKIINHTLYGKIYDIKI